MWPNMSIVWKCQVDLSITSGGSSFQFFNKTLIFDGCRSPIPNFLSHPGRSFNELISANISYKIIERWSEEWHIAHNLIGLNKLNIWFLTIIHLQYLEERRRAGWRRRHEAGWQGRQGAGWWRRQEAGWQGNTSTFC